MLVIVSVYFQTKKSKTPKKKENDERSTVNLRVNLGPPQIKSGKKWRVHTWFTANTRGNYTIECQKALFWQLADLVARQIRRRRLITVVQYPEPVRHVTPKITPSTLHYVSAYHLLTGEKRNPKISWTHISGKDHIAHAKVTQNRRRSVDHLRFRLSPFTHLIQTLQLMPSWRHQDKQPGSKVQWGGEH